jgi:hypothetical protein
MKNNHHKVGLVGAFAGTHMAAALVAAVAVTDVGVGNLNFGRLVGDAAASVGQSVRNVDVGNVQLGKLAADGFASASLSISNVSVRGVDVPSMVTSAAKAVGNTEINLNYPQLRQMPR